MPVIKLLAASKIEGAPSQPFLSKITKEYEKYPFLRNTAKGWRIDTDDPAWGDYLRGRREKRNKAPSPPPVNETAPTRACGEGANTKPPPEPDREAEASTMNAYEARSLLAVQKALKAEIDKKKAELELNVLEGRYIDKPRMIYYMGYFQRAITEGLDNIKREETDAGAVKAVCEKLKAHIALTIEALRKDEGLEI
jgi:hypothetical protein